MACQRLTTTRPSSMTSNNSIPVPPPKLIPQQFQFLPRILGGLMLLLVVAMAVLSFRFRLSQTVFAAHRDGLLLQGGSGTLTGKRYLYWGAGIDCPGKHCVRCGGLGHQESSLRCALEEAMFLNRTFVLPSRMCIANEHTNTRLPHHHEKEGSLELSLHRCSMDMLYDLDSMSRTVPVVLSNSKEWQEILEREHATFAEVEGIKTEELQRNSMFQQARVINRTASKLAWFMECKNRHNRSALTLPHSFLPSMAARPLHVAADLIKTKLQDYDALHVRRGDKVRVYEDVEPGTTRTMYADLDRDTQPEAIMGRIKLWVPAGRTLYIATDEKRIHYFDKLCSKYRVVKAENFSAILGAVVHNNYQLFMVERLVVLGAKTAVKTWKEDPGDLSLSDEAKKKKKKKKRPHRLWKHALTSAS